MRLLLGNSVTDQTTYQLLITSLVKLPFIHCSITQYCLSKVDRFFSAISKIFWSIKYFFYLNLLTFINIFSLTSSCAQCSDWGQVPLTVWGERRILHLEQCNWRISVFVGIVRFHPTQENYKFQFHIYWFFNWSENKHGFEANNHRSLLQNTQISFTASLACVIFWLFLGTSTIAIQNRLQVFHWGRDSNISSFSDMKLTET